MFDWRIFVERHGLQYRDRGRNVAAGNIAIDCPFCGERAKFHMGLHLRSGAWGCWKSKAHRGGKPHRLIQALIGCSYARACEIVGDERSVSLDSLDGVLAALENPSATERARARTVRFPPEIKPLEDRSLGRYFIDYLANDRLYGYRDARSVARRYGLRYATRGPFAYRVVFPIEMPHGVVNWTGRAIGKDVDLRYRTLSTDPEKAKRDGLPVAGLSVERTLWNFAELAQCRGGLLVVTEGPFDAMRLDWLGEPYGVRSTCTFGKVFSEDQMLLLDEIAGNFDRLVLMRDRDASLDMIEQQDRLSYLGFDAVDVPSGFKDPAEFDEKTALDILGI